MKNADTDLTLPAVAADLRSRRRDSALVLTIVFHPDTSRIGQWAVVPRQGGRAPCVVGRRTPVFSRGCRGDPAPLQDPHISRRALQLDYNGDALLLHRCEPSSRCQLAGNEVYGSVELGAEQLAAGVPLLLGHCIVLMLRLGSAHPRATECNEALAQFCGSSACMAGIRAQVQLAAQGDLDVLVRGETGTGKELVAAAIHAGSGRREAPMISVNMAAIPAELASAALFGSARGAFTGAAQRATGYFEQAQGGTLFLDEIGDAAVCVQPLLLRALQQREIQAVGGAITSVDVRVISATDAPLEGPNSTFKSALRHRLAATEIVLPSLREHPEDVGELLYYFLSGRFEKLAGVGLLPGPATPALEVAAWANIFYQFLAYRWPGNIRELANAAQQIVLARGEPPVLNDPLRTTLTPHKRIVSGCSGSPAHRRIHDVERQDFDHAMLSNGFQPLRVARYLGVSRSAVYRRMASSGHYRLVSDISERELAQVLETHAGNSKTAAEQLRVNVSSLRGRLRKLAIEWH